MGSTRPGTCRLLFQESTASRSSASDRRRQQLGDAFGFFVKAAAARRFRRGLFQAGGGDRILRGRLVEPFVAVRIAIERAELELFERARAVPHALVVAVKQIARGVVA